MPGCVPQAFPNRDRNARLHTHRKDNRTIFAEQIKIVVDRLEPIGICVYGPASDELFGYARSKGVEIYQYDSYTMKENTKDKARRLSEVKTNEGK